MSFTNYEMVQGEQVIELGYPDNDVAVFVYAPEGKVVLGGGGVVPADPEAVWALTYCRPFFDSVSYGFIVQAHLMSGTVSQAGSVVGWAICATVEDD